MLRRYIGKPSDAGILPRVLDVLFNSIHGKQMEGMSLKPKMFTDVMKLTSEQQNMERKLREKTLKLGNDEVRICRKINQSNWYRIKCSLISRIHSIIFHIHNDMCLRHIL